MPSLYAKRLHLRLELMQVQYSNRRGFYMCAPLPSDSHGNVTSMPFPQYVVLYRVVLLHKFCMRLP